MPTTCPLPDTSAFSPKAASPIWEEHTLASTVPAAAFRFTHTQTYVGSASIFNLTTSKTFKKKEVTKRKV